MSSMTYMCIAKLFKIGHALLRMIYIGERSLELHCPPPHTHSLLDSPYIRDWSLITGRGATKGEGVRGM